MLAIPETHRDLLESDVAILATIGPDGQPQVTALWFLFDEDGLVKLALNNTRQKVKNLQAHPECTLFIIDRANPLRTLEIRARAEVRRDDDFSVSDKLGRKYGADVRSMDPPGQYRVAVTLRPIKVNAIDLSRG